MDLTIAEHMKCEEDEVKLREERRVQALRNEDTGSLERANKVLGQASVVLADTAEWFRKLMGANGPNAARKVDLSQRDSSSPANDSEDIPLGSLRLRTPEPIYHPSANPLTLRSGNKRSAAATGSRKKHRNILPSIKEYEEDEERYDGWGQPMDG